MLMEIVGLLMYCYRGSRLLMATVVKPLVLAVAAAASVLVGIIDVVPIGQVIIATVTHNS